MSRRILGIAIIAGGAVLVFVAAAADLIGISSGGSAHQFGKNQMIGTAVGAAIVAVGILISFLPVRPVTAGATRRVSSPGATAAASPGTDDATGAFLAAGTVVTVDEIQGEWARVAAPDGSSGWVPTSSLF